ncbi:MAG: M6 family metalloprotease domain-containing protein [Bacteroidales bacterium]|nr:M6 family metalloprotease domain-containing protein [Bacteroidales bacterium]
MKRVCLLSGLVMLAFSLFAGYLKNFPITVTQPDGSVVNCFVTGDEYYNWVHDENGFTLIRDPQTGVVVYAMLQDDELVSTGYRVGSVDPASLGLEPEINISAEKRKQLRQEFLEHKPKKETKEHDSTTGSVRTAGTLNNIVIYIRFSDDSEFQPKANTYQDWFNKDADNFSSLYRYFKSLSNEKLFISTTFYPTASGNTILSYQDSYPRSYFQPYNASSNPNGYQGGDSGNERRDREHQLLKRAIDAVRSQIPPSLNLDCNNDGEVDNVCFVVRGGAGGWNSILWPHQWYLYSLNVTLNGKRVMIYNFQVETVFDQQGASVLAHEMFHSLGAPDLYRYVNENIDPVGPWDLMNMNATPPQSSAAYMRLKYGGWLNNIPEITQPGTYTLNNVWSATNNAYKIASPNSSSEYFVIEYRDKNVYWDSALPGSGLIIYRVNTLAEGNMDGPPDEVYIFRPGGNNNNTDGNINNAFFSSQAGRTVFNDSSNPPCFLSNNQPGGISISNISASGGTTMSFELSDAGACPGPSNMTVNYTSDCNAQISWNAPNTKTIGITPETDRGDEIVFNNFPVAGATLLSEAHNENTKFSHNFAMTGGEPYDASDRASGWLGWCGPLYDAIGTGGQVEFIVAARFVPSDLATAGIKTGDVITKMRFVPAHVSYIAAVTLAIYQGGSSPTNPGALVCQQDVTQNLLEQQHNEITLNTPYAINASQELWIGYYVATYGGYPAGCDAGPSVVGKGDLIYLNNAWSNLLTVTNFTVSANWNIEAFVITGGTEDTKYNVYRDGVLVASNIAETSYTDSGFSPYANHTWSVRATCSGGGESAVASVTKESCVVGIEAPPSPPEGGDVRVYPNPTSGLIMICDVRCAICDIAIFDVMGRAVVVAQSHIENRTSQIALDLSNLPAGVYFIRITTADGVVTRKVVKE